MAPRDVVRNEVPVVVRVGRGVDGRDRIGQGDGVFEAVGLKGQRRETGPQPSELRHKSLGSIAVTSGEGDGG
jgi:hypothetical protein